MRRRHEKSQEIMGIVKNFSPDIQQLSVDAAFLDMSGTEKIFGDIEAADRNRIHLFSILHYRCCFEVYV